MLTKKTQENRTHFIITHNVSSMQNKKTKVRILVNQQIDQPKVLISDDRHNNIHTSSSFNEITIRNKNTPTHYISIGQM
jgi:hypothetical protein